MSIPITDYEQLFDLQAGDYEITRPILLPRSGRFSEIIGKGRGRTRIKLHGHGLLALGMAESKIGSDYGKDHFVDVSSLLGKDYTGVRRYGIRRGSSTGSKLRVVVPESPFTLGKHLAGWKGVEQITLTLTVGAKRLIPSGVYCYASDTGGYREWLSVGVFDWGHKLQVRVGNWDGDQTYSGRFEWRLDEHETDDFHLETFRIELKPGDIPYVWRSGHEQRLSLSWSRVPDAYWQCHQFSGSRFGSFRLLDESLWLDPDRGHETVLPETDADAVIVEAKLYEGSLLKDKHLLASIDFRDGPEADSLNRLCPRVKCGAATGAWDQWTRGVIWTYPNTDIDWRGGHANENLQLYGSHPFRLADLTIEGLPNTAYASAVHLIGSQWIEMDRVWFSGHFARSVSDRYLGTMYQCSADRCTFRGWDVAWFGGQQQTKLTNCLFDQPGRHAVRLLSGTAHLDYCYSNEAYQNHEAVAFIHGGGNTNPGLVVNSFMWDHETGGLPYFRGFAFAECHPTDSVNIRIQDVRLQPHPTAVILDLASTGSVEEVKRNSMAILDHALVYGSRPEDAIRDRSNGQYLVRLRNMPQRAPDPPDFPNIPAR